MPHLQNYFTFSLSMSNEQVHLAVEVFRDAVSKSFGDFHTHDSDPLWSWTAYTIKMAALFTEQYSLI